MTKHWNCFVAECNSNWRNSHLYFYVPLKKELLSHYKSFFRTDGIDWRRRQCICSLHWSKPRRNSQHLPDIRVPTGSRQKRSAREHRAVKRGARESRRNKLLEKSQPGEILQNVKESLSEVSGENATLRVHLRQQVTDNELLASENFRLRNTIEKLKKELKESEEVRKLEQRNVERIMENKWKFSWDTVTESYFKYFTGMSRDSFETLFSCLKPYLHLIKYQSCISSKSYKRKVSKENELFTTLSICRHALHMEFAGWMLKVSASTMSRIFEAWIVFGDAVFSMVDLQPSHELMKKVIPQIYQELGFGHITLVLDATEFKTKQFSDLNLNTIFFSDYKQCHTVKALVCLAPPGALTMVPDLYPGSITDTTITQITGSLRNCLLHDGILTDKGFAISELAAEKGAEHNIPPMKTENQFCEGECDDNYKIACLRIHVERWIGYLRNFEILNSVWACNRMPLLNSTWRFLAYIQSMTTLVGPAKKEQPVTNGNN